MKVKSVKTCLKGRVDKWWKQIIRFRKKERKTKVKDWKKMKKKLDKFFSTDYVPTKCGEVRNTFDKFEFNDKLNFAVYLDEENLNQYEDIELHEEPIFEYCYESAMKRI